MARTSQPTVEQALETNLAWLRDVARKHGLQRVAVDMNGGAEIECVAKFDDFGTRYGNRIRKFREMSASVTKTLSRQGWKPGRATDGAMALLRSPDRRFELRVIDREVTQKKEALTEVGVVLVDRKAG